MMTHLSLEGSGKAEEGIDVCILEEAVVDFGSERIMVMMVMCRHCCHDGRMMDSRGGESLYLKLGVGSCPHN